MRCHFPCPLSCQDANHQQSNSRSVVDYTPRPTKLFHDQWSHGSTEMDVSGLMAGDYFVTVTDENNCLLELGKYSELNALADALVADESRADANPRIYYLVANSSFEEKDYSAAKRYLDQYLAIAKSSPKSLWLGIRIERIFNNKDKEASYILALKNLYPYSKEYLEYKTLLDKQVQPNER